MTVVVDSWAVMRFLEDIDPASTTVAELFTLDRPIMSWVNLGEVFYVLRRVHGEHDAMEAVRDLQNVVESELPTSNRILEAARLKADYPMAYADAFAAATAMAHDAVLWTGDPDLLVDAAPWEWRDLR